MEPSDRPENSVPAVCARPMRRSIARIEAAAAARTSASASTQVAAAPSPRFSSSAASRFFTAASDEPPSACAAFRRSAGLGEASSSLAVA